MIRRSSQKLVIYFAILAVFSACAALADAATYYVATTGNDAADGTSEQSAWKTISHAAMLARPGDTVYIAGGQYGPEHVTFANSGTADKPIVFEGRGATRPLLDNGVRVGDYKNIGILVANKQFITIRNIDLTQYMICVKIQNSSNIVLENITAYDCGWEKWMGTGIALEAASRCQVRNCTVKNAGGEDVHLIWSDDNVLENCQMIGTLDGADRFATDYYMVISWSSRNTIKNCMAKDQTYTGKGNHGIGLKDTQAKNPRNQQHGHSTGNQFINCSAFGFEEGIFCAWGGHHNTYTNCLGDSSQKKYFFRNAIMVRDGAHDNTFKNCKGIGGEEALCVYDNEKVNQNPNKMETGPQENNKFINCIFECKPRVETDVQLCMFLRNAKNTTFENCSFMNGNYLVRFGKDAQGADGNTGTKFVNCAVSNVKQLVDLRSLKYPWDYDNKKVKETAGYDGMARVSFTNCSFWKNGFAKPAGQGNVEKAFAAEAGK
ncbi:right-handed parallel beta-helix repeat-containing protein [bacterium]|nr:right-handed parallel beta-helix repeat-containing protein [bacterium]